MADVNWREVWVGTTTVAVTSITLAVLAMTGAGGVTNDQDSFVIQAEFGRIDGLGLDSPVRLAGLDIGFVSAIALNNEQRALVSLSINDPDISIPSDTAAVIETDGIFGEKYVELHPGGEFELLRNGQRISYVQDSVVLESLLNQVVSRAKVSKTKSKDGER